MAGSPVLGRFDTVARCDVPGVRVAVGSADGPPAPAIVSRRPSCRRGASRPRAPGTAGDGETPHHEQVDGDGKFAPDGTRHGGLAPHCFDADGGVDRSG